MAKKLFRWSQLLFDAAVGIRDHSGKIPLGAAALSARCQLHWRFVTITLAGEARVIGASGSLVG